MKINLSENQYEQDFGKNSKCKRGQFFRPFWDSSARSSEWRSRWLLMFCWLFIFCSPHRAEESQKGRKLKLTIGVCICWLFPNSYSYQFTDKLIFIYSLSAIHFIILANCKFSRKTYQFNIHPVNIFNFSHTIQYKLVCQSALFTSLGAL